ncbi:Bacillopeptidase [Lentibacillus sp. JNUCC-1]|uniref:S8 family serine peptidase n=1 Tax=Lentibacillus sp. JNUCC-1 TaxID=2654513 RepID=UPI0012E81B69|nr:S8 family serine peptidase [Lentibacillus sp. JNUCC-1]MUV37309.1 Bacillopeptidase [Lentibacillus sp. JNUCC-1]
MHTNKGKTYKLIHIFAVFLMLVSVILPASSQVEASERNQNQLNKNLLKEFETTEKVTYLVKFKEKADTTKAIKTAEKHASNKNLSKYKRALTREKAVIKSLKETSKTSHQDVLSYLKEKVKTGEASDIHSYFIVNGMAVTSTKEVAEEIASFSEVEKILPNKRRQLITNDVNRLKKGIDDKKSIEWNVDRVGAPAVWNEGIDGAGVVVASIDSGVQWDHPALKEKYRGYNAQTGTVNHELSWYDALDESDIPFDDVGHGTHVTGTMVGSETDGSKNIGMAPGAKWVSVKAFAEEGGGTDVDLLRAAEWIMAPKDANGNEHPEMRPDIVNNSWGGGTGLDEWYRDVVKSWRDVGIFPVFAAGNISMYNPGGPGSVETPANYPESFAVGATDSDNMIGDFSLRGPSPYEEIKPDIVAPGVAIYSSVPGNDYADKNGTSMATPAVSGAAALLLSYDDSYSVKQIENILIQTAEPLTDQDHLEVPNNAYGHGLVDIFNAVSSSREGLGTIEGQLTDTEGNPVTQPGYITVEETDRTVRTKKDGSFTLVHPVGTVTLKTDVYGYHIQKEQIQIKKDETIQAKLKLEEISKGTLSGQISDINTGNTVENATLLLKEDENVDPVRSDEKGRYMLEAYMGHYTLIVTAPGYKDHEVKVDLNEGEQTKDISLDPYYTYPGDEIGYDNGVIDNGSMYFGGGAGWAVKMTLPDDHESAVVKEGVFAFIDKGFSEELGTEFAVEVWDATGPKGMPGEKLAGPIDAEVTWENEWTSVDLSEENIKVDEEFYIVYVQTMEYPNAPGLATDNGNPYAGRSYQYTDGSFYPAFVEDGNYMIRTRVDYKLDQPVITSPEDGAVTSEDTITVQGTGSPYTAIQLMNNEKDAGEVVIDEDGTFEAQVDLMKDNNELKAISTVEGSELVESDSVTVTREKLNIINIEPAEDQYLTPGDKVKVTFESNAKGGKANFHVSLPSAKMADTNANMEEVEPGVYEGIWTTPKNVNLEGAEVIVSLENKSGNVVTATAGGNLFIYPDNVERISGDLRYDTAIETSKKGWDKADTVVLARGDEFADALAGVPLAHELDAPILLTPTDELWEGTEEEAARLEANKVIILGGENAINAGVEQTLSDSGLDVRRINGADRFETATLIAKEVAPNGSNKVAVANGMDFPDALSVAASAAQEGMPILLAKESWLPEATKETVKDLGVEKTYVVGGTTVINDDITKQLPKVTRLAGDDRYDTNIKVLDHFEAASKHMYVATGKNYADALTGAVLAAKNNSQILLVHDKVPDLTADYISSKGLRHLSIFGGKVAVSDEVAIAFKSIME